MYKYKYKYKYGSTDTKRIHSESDPCCKEEGFISQQEQPVAGVLGKPIPGYEPSYFYEHTDGKGNFFTLYPGQSTPNVGGDWNDRISSVKVGARTSVILTEHDRYKGALLNTLVNRNPSGAGELINLTDRKMEGKGFFPPTWNDQATSIIVAPLA